MALDRAYRVRCDRCFTGTGFFESSQKARASAVRRGWKRAPKKDGEPGRDLCLRCSGSTKDGTDGERFYG